MTGKRYNLDFITMQRYAQKLQTPTTPSIPHMYALDFQLSRILQEGDARSRRHEEMAEMTRRWARRNGFELFSEPGAESRTVTCIRNTRDISVKGLNEALAGKARISDGYGCLKQKTFRIGHMGDMRKEELSSLLHDIEVILQ